MDKEVGWREEEREYARDYFGIAKKSEYFGVSFLFVKLKFVDEKYQIKVERKIVE